MVVQDHEREEALAADFDGPFEVELPGLVGGGALEGLPGVWFLGPRQNPAVAAEDLLDGLAAGPVEAPAAEEGADLAAAPAVAVADVEDLLFQVGRVRRGEA